MSRFTDHDIMIGLLAVYAEATRSLHIGNVIGRSYQVGDLERRIASDIQFTSTERAQAAHCAKELVQSGLLVPTYSDITAPEEWLIITDAGKDALRRGATDELDKALYDLDPSFIEMRRGAWRSAQSLSPDSLRQAAHSGRELVNQVLKVVAPDEAVREQSWYNPREKDKVTRRDRYKVAVQKRSRGMSENDLEIALKATELLEAQRTKLDAEAHTRNPIERQTVLDALSTVDMVLRNLLV